MPFTPDTNSGTGEGNPVNIDHLLGQEVAPEVRARIELYTQELGEVVHQEFEVITSERSASFGVLAPIGPVEGLQIAEFVVTSVRELIQHGPNAALFQASIEPALQIAEPIIKAFASPRRPGGRMDNEQSLTIYQMGTTIVTNINTAIQTETDFSPGNLAAVVLREIYHGLKK